MKQLVVLAALAMFVTGCAFSSHDAKIAINQPQAAPVNVGAGMTLHLTVLDERDDPDLGRRGAGVSVAKVKAEDIFPRFVQAVEEGFRAKGFELTDDSTPANAKLTVSLRTLKFEESMGFWTVGAEADATILASAQRGDQDYRNQYRSSDEDRQLAVSFGEGIDEQLSLVLNDVLAQLLSDQRLDEFLTAK